MMIIELISGEAVNPNESTEKTKFVLYGLVRGRRPHGLAGGWLAGWLTLGRPAHYTDQTKRVQPQTRVLSSTAKLFLSFYITNMSLKM